MCSALKESRIIEKKKFCYMFFLSSYRLVNVYSQIQCSIFRLFRVFNWQAIEFVRSFFNVPYDRQKTVSAKNVSDISSRAVIPGVNITPILKTLGLVVLINVCLITNIQNIFAVGVFDTDEDATSPREPSRPVEPKEPAGNDRDARTPGLDQPVRLDDVNFDYSQRSQFVLKGKWYLKPSFYVNYYNLGSDIQKAFDQISGIFGGDPLRMQIATKTTTLNINASSEVGRAATNILPTGNFGGGYIMGKHRFEFDLGLAGLVPLNTADISTTATVREQCSGALSDCPLARLGFVDENTLAGEYSLKFVINERIWILTPTFHYDWLWRQESWGTVAFGGSLGAMFLTAIQNVEFQARRTDGPTGSLDTRVLEGAASSTAVGDWGPQMRLFANYRRNVKGFDIDIRVGVSYGWVTLDRNVDGIGQALIGDQIAASFPLSAIGIANREATKFELLGFYLQAGVMF